MNYSNRNELPSCSSLPRLVQCPGSWDLSRGVPDEPSEHSTSGSQKHLALRCHVIGLPRPDVMDDEEWEIGGTIWGFMLRSAQDFCQTEDLEWKSEVRLWMTDGDLSPIFSGQFDVLCLPKDRDYAIIYEAKTGWTTGEIPKAKHNHQVAGMAALVWESYSRIPYAAVVREFACDPVVKIECDWVRPFVESISQGEFDNWRTAGLKMGPECNYCVAKGNCPAYRDSLAVVLQNESISATLQAVEPEGLVRILRAAPMAKKVIEAAQDEARRRKDAGVELPGVIWEPGAKKRRIKDQVELGRLLEGYGVDVAAIKGDIEITLGQAESAYLKATGLKKGKKSSDQFNNQFKQVLEWKDNQPSITFTE